MTVEQRRLKAYALSSELIGELFQEGRTFGCEEGYDRLTIVKGFPESAQVVSAEYDNLQRCFVIVLEHESFDPVSEAVPIIPEKVVRWRWGDLPQGAIEVRTEHDN